MTHPHEPDPDLHPQYLAPFLAFLLPGLGHVSLGRVRRGVYVAIGVLGLFFGGLFVAGIGAVDSSLWYVNKINALTGKKPVFQRVDGDPVWFLGQMFVGPIAFGTDLIHQFRFKVNEQSYLRTALPNEIRNPLNGTPIRVRDQQGNPIAFTDPLSNQTRMSTPADRPPYVKPLGRVAEVGTLMCTIAGMLNLIAIVDCAYSRRGPERKAKPQGAAS